MLQEGCSACFIVPRSFCSGRYFTRFRQEFLDRVTVEHIHLFESRSDAFRQDDVLQENLVITFTSQNKGRDSWIKISSSSTLRELTHGITSRQITRTQFMSPIGLLRLPTSELDEMILEVVDRWKGSFSTYDIAISTGPVVPFRVEKYLINEPTSIPVVPLLWMQHITSHRITWPLNYGFRKPQHILNIPQTETMLVENTNYVLLRRFSAKEERRRLVAAPYLSNQFECARIGLENHLNYIYRRAGEMSETEVVGLSALLNSGLIDRYFRISNGNTQVNATELRALPLPPLQVITAMGQAVMEEVDTVDLDAIVVQTLQTYLLLPTDFPILRETRAV
jgi:adenine-specific DNA-methyltransferase